MENNKKYYIYYNCVQRKWCGDNLKSNCNDNFQDVTDIHPLRWQKEQNEKYAKFILDEHDDTYYSEFKVIHWQEIDNEIYNEFDGYF